MKVKLKEAEEPKEKKQAYPFIGVAETGEVVLFKSDSVGILLINGTATTVSLLETHNEWTMSYFTPYKGKVILSND